MFTTILKIKFKIETYINTQYARTVRLLRVGEDDFASL